MRSLSPVLVALALASVLTACSDDGDAAAVAIETTDNTCQAAETGLPAGKTTFEVHNGGNQVTEVYVYAEDDRVVTEKENIGPGTSATFTVSLPAGTYEIACKPGMTGDGIRQQITVTGEGGEALSDHGDIEVHFTSVDYTWDGLEDFDIHAGETVEFEMVNDGTINHEFEVFGPDGDVLGEIGPTAPGEEGKLILALEEPGEYTYVCGIDDHADRGMTGTFVVE